MDELKQQVKYNDGIVMQKELTDKELFQQYVDREENLLSQAKYEIENLRKVNHTMSTRLGMFDDLMFLTKSVIPKNNYGMCKNDYDIVDRIADHLTKPISKESY